jgi:hydrogenase/urease accessory protein HupE
MNRTTYVMFAALAFGWLACPAAFGHPGHGETPHSSGVWHYLSTMDHLPQIVMVVLCLGLVTLLGRAIKSLRNASKPQDVHVELP